MNPEDYHRGKYVWSEGDVEVVENGDAFQDSAPTTPTSRRNARSEEDDDQA